jgi:transposase InsO family protein
VIDVRSRKVVAWNIAERENPAIAADLVGRACLRERISKGRLKELGILRSFSRQRVSNDNPYSESLFRTAKYRPDYPGRPFTSKEAACQWVSSFVD